MSCGGGLGRSNTRAKAHCFDPDVEPEQESKATSPTGTGIGNSQGCYKPENQRLCGIGPQGDPVQGTPRAEWEKEHGKLRTIFEVVRVPICGGHSTGQQYVHSKIVIPPKPKKPNKRVRCCSVRYKSCPTSC